MLCFGVLENDSTAYIFQLTDRLTEELPGALSLNNIIRKRDFGRYQTTLKIVVTSQSAEGFMGVRVARDV